MTSKYDFVVCAIEEANDIDKMTLDELESSLRVHEKKFIRQANEGEQALKATTDGTSNRSNRGRGRERGRGRGNSPYQNQEMQNFNTQGRGRGRGRSQSTNYRDKSNIECYRCHKFGHYKNECRTYMHNNKGENSNFAEMEQEEEIALLLMTDTKEDTTKKYLWYLDTGCSNHMCGEKSLFSDLDEAYRDAVKFGNNSHVAVMGKGHIHISARGNFKISDVLYVPELKTNLLSMGQLQEKGFEIIIKDGACRIQSKNLGTIAEAKMTPNRLFPLNLKSMDTHCFSVVVNDVAWLWHFRYGHLNFGGLKTLQKKSMVKGLPNFDSPSNICEDCVVSKQHRVPFPKSGSQRAKKPLDIVHYDICGPINPTSNGGKRYFITFIDDYSRKTWVYFLQVKSEAFAAFKSFKALVEKESGNVIKVLRTDRGGEYCSHEFENFCESHGIKKQLTAAYTPQQNGVSERKNRTILDMVRSLLTRSGVPKSFWPEVVNWSIHILNRSPTFSVQNVTPEQAWNGRRPSVDHFRIFGCIAYAHIPDEKRKKLDDKGEKCIFLGVSSHSKAFKLYNPYTKKIVISRDVVFDERKFWNWSANKLDRQQVLVDLGDEVDKEEAENVQPVPNQDITEQGKNTSSTHETNDGRPQRNRKRPAWMIDYEVPGIDQSDDELSYFALFSDCDPVMFDDAVADAKWRKAMDEEIAAIERNNTWELVELP